MTSFKNYLNCLFGSEDDIYLRLLDDKRRREYTPREMVLKLKDIDYELPQLQKLNGLGYGIFVGVNGARRDDEVTKIHAQFFEADDLPIETQLENIRAFPLRPTMVVKTRKSLHVYFKIKDGTIERFRDIQIRLARHFQGDKSIVNPSRILRAPGFKHCKEEPIPVQLIECNPELVYTQAQIEEALPNLPPKEPEKNESTEAQQHGTKEQLEYLCEHCLFIQHCKEHSAILSEIDWYHMICVLSGFDGGPEKIHELSKNYPRYDVDETDRKIEHFKSTETNPVTCNTIAEKGFVCSELGKCPCKSPAGLPFTVKNDLSKRPWYEPAGKSGVRLMPGVLAEYLTKNIRAVFTTGRFYLYEDGYYREASDFEIEQVILRNLIIQKARASDINDVKTQWRIRISKNVETINSDPYLINVNNGLLDLHTFTLLPHSAEQLSTIRIHANYDPISDCPRFKAFLSESLDADAIPVVQEMLGYSMSMLSEAQMSFIFDGVPRSGKSTIIRVLEGIVGRENVSNIPLQNLGDRFKAAELHGKVLNAFSDLPLRVMEESSTFKSIVGNDTIMAERKNQDPFTFRPFAKLMFSTNDLPAMTDRTGAVFRRLSIIKFNKTVPTNKINVNLTAELLEEADGIFAWSMEGLKRLIENNFRFDEAKSSAEALERYRVDCNSALAFVEEECEIHLGDFVRSSELYERYKDYCRRNGLHPMAQNNFSGELARNYKDQLTKRRHPKTRQVIWDNLRLMDSPDAMEDQAMDSSIISINRGNSQGNYYSNWPSIKR